MREGQRLLLFVLLVQVVIPLVLKCILPSFGWSEEVPKHWKPRQVSGWQLALELAPLYVLAFVALYRVSSWPDDVPQAIRQENHAS